MNIGIKLSRTLDDQIRKDLNRPHKFAFERVGFVSSRYTPVDGNGILVLLSGYLSVDDDDYMEDDSVGARINGNAIRKAMQKVLDTKEGMFHVHIHPSNAVPGLSLVDKEEIPPVVQNFRNVDGGAVHGILLMSTSRYKAFVMLPKEPKLIPTTRVSVVGFPMSLNR